MYGNDLGAVIKVRDAVLVIRLTAPKDPAMWMNIAFDPLIKDTPASMVHKCEEPAQIIIFILFLIVRYAVNDEGVRADLLSLKSRTLRVPIGGTNTDLVAVAAFKFRVRIKFLSIVDPFVVETIKVVHILLKHLSVRHLDVLLIGPIASFYFYFILQFH